MSGILYFLLAILVFGLIVFFHEMGHYLVGRACGIRVYEFAVGFGPKLIGWRRKDIDYSVRILPLGGYCKFGEDETSDDPHAFSNAPVWKRFLTIFAGPAMNFVLAFLAVFIFLSIIGTTYTVPTVYGVTAGMPAESSGLQAGDRITAVDGVPIEYSTDGAQKLVAAIGVHGSETPVALTVERDGQTLEISVSTQETEDGDRVGIELGYEISRSPVDVLQVSWQNVVGITQLMLDGFKNLITKGEGLEDTMGPVGIISFMTREISQNLEAIVNLIVIISLNVGILNLLPLPALDGGRLVFLIIEGIRRKPIKPEYEGWVHAAGFFLLMGLVVVFTYRDIVRLVTGG